MNKQTQSVMAANMAYSNLTEDAKKDAKKKILYVGGALVVVGCILFLIKK